jgi:hypothetical protein
MAGRSLLWLAALPAGFAKRQCVLLIGVAVCGFAPAHADPASEGFKKLSGVQIRRAVIGHTFSDDIHFAFRYAPNGLVEGAGMGKKVIRKWSINKDQLCVTDEVGENCYIVWKKEAAVRLVFPDSDLSLDGILK